MGKLLYLDNAATTKTAPEVVDAMLPYFTEHYGNPSSVYSFSSGNKEMISKQREAIADTLGASANEIYFTAGGSESDNWALKATAEAYAGKGNHIITTKIEHHAILHTAQYLEKRGIYIGAHLLSVRDAEDAAFPETDLTAEQVAAPGKKSFPVLDDSAEERMRGVIEEARRNEDSVGGIVEVAVTGMPAGIGSPIFDTVEGRLSFGYFGIPAVKGVEFGAGFRASELRGSENNDAFYIDEDGSVKTRTNHHGGILGGISSGMPVIARLAFKPTPSIGKEQDTVDFIRGEETKLRITGRHDPCVAVRAVPVVEAMTAVVLTDMLLEQEGYKAE